MDRLFRPAVAFDGVKIVAKLARSKAIALLEEMRLPKHFLRQEDSLEQEMFSNLQKGNHNVVLLSLAVITLTSELSL